MPLLTVITPVYNGERFIESCIQSVISQHCPDAEHLIIDGGSTDMTLQIIERYAKHNAHIRFISEKDNGQSAAMNKGIALARGSILGFLNNDDFYQPNVLPRILEIFKTLPTPSFLVGNCNILNDDEKVVNINKPTLNLVNILIGGKKNQFPYNPSAYFYHKSLHEKIGLYNESDHYGMDLDFILRTVKVANIHYVDETWGNYRYIRGTKTFNAQENNQLDSNIMRVRNIYIAQLPFIQRWWVKIFRFFYIEHMPRYYMGRLADCLKHPKEMVSIIKRKMNK